MLATTAATGLDFRRVCDEVPLAQCWAIRAWRELENPWVPMGLVEGYVGQEIARVLADCHRGKPVSQ